MAWVAWVHGLHELEGTLVMWEERKKNKNKTNTATHR